MRVASLRLFAITLLAVASIAAAVSGVFATDDLSGCVLSASEGDSPDLLGSMLEAVDVAAPGDVWAVGSNVVGGGTAPFAERSIDGAWGTQRLDVPPGHSPGSSLYAIKAFTPDDVWAVGSLLGERPLIEHWDGARWTAVRGPRLSGTERILTGVGGDDPHDLWVVGQHRVNQQEVGVVFHRSTAGWRSITPPSGAAALHDVEMVAPGVPLVAGWSIGTDGYAEALLASYEDGGWVRESTPAMPQHNVFIMGVATGSAGEAWAVGFSNDSPNADAPVILHRNAGSWTAEADVTGSFRLLSVATGELGTVAVGQASSDGVIRATALRETAGSWSPIPGAADNPPDALSGVALDGVAVWSVGKRIVTGGTYGIPTARVYSCG